MLFVKPWHMQSENIQSSKMMNISKMITRKECRVGDKRVQVFSLSDVHTDNALSCKWLKENCVGSQDDGVFSVFICAGDISHDLRVIRETFAHLKAHYDEVCYVPGNHDLWRRGSEIPSRASGVNATCAPCSVSKLNEIMKCALQEGVTMGPLRIRTTVGNLYIYPLYAWYHSGWDTEPVLSHPLYTSCERLKLRERATFDFFWADFRGCSWPNEVQQSSIPPSIFRDDVSVAKAFAALNEDWLPPVCPRGHTTAKGELEIETVDDWPLRPCDEPGATVLSYSHFLPRQELLPEKRFLLEPMLSRVVGSDLLREQVQRLAPHLHVFGHTHIPIDISLDGIRYVQWALDNARDALSQCHTVAGSGPMLIYDTDIADSQSECTSSSPCIPAEILCTHSRWSDYYRKNSRNPSIHSELSPWLEQKLQKFMTDMVESGVRAK